MNTKVISGAKPRFHLAHNLSTKKPTSQNTTSTLSFKSHFTKSNLYVKSPTGSGKTRSPTRIHAFYAPAETLCTEVSLYEVLGIAESVNSLSEIKKAYKQMALKYHPDVSPPDRVDEHTKRFIMVHEAYETLSDPQSRAMYDRDLAGGLSTFSFSGKRPRQHYNQSMEETGEMRVRWQSQVDELKRRSVNSSTNNEDFANRQGKMSWGARMRKQRL